MQKIFYNAKFLTLNEHNEDAEAMLVNDDAIVFVGKKDEVLNLKTEDTQFIDLEEKFIMPTFFDVNLKVYQIIEDRIKNAKKEQNIENIALDDENYEKFCNFELYASEFDEVQNELLSLGITTIQEEISNRQEFIFWKKISESGKLKIDVIGYVDFIQDKQIMDDNCRSYRKYKNHFRLGGYYLNLDGSLNEKTAWLKKSYPKEKGYKAYGKLGFEHLSLILKTALEEKKQLLVHANGDMALEQFLIVYEEYIKENKIEDNFRPVVIGCNFASKKLLKKMSEFKIAPVFQIDNFAYDNKKLIANFGKIKAKKSIPILKCNKHNIDYFYTTKETLMFNTFEIINYLTSKKAKSFYVKGAQTVNNILQSLILVPAYYAFDLEQKGSFESGKKANFLVLKNNIFELKFKNENLIEQIYLEGELIFDINKK